MARTQSGCSKSHFREYVVQFVGAEGCCGSSEHERAEVEKKAAFPGIRAFGIPPQLLAVRFPVKPQKMPSTPHNGKQIHSALFWV